MTKFSKVKPILSAEDFLEKVKEVKEFISIPKGKRYQVIAIEGKKMRFFRVGTGKKWSMDLDGLYKAYKALDDSEFSNTENFRPYVSWTHSPARGLLVKLGLIKQI